MCCIYLNMICEQEIQYDVSQHKIIIKILSSRLTQHSTILSTIIASSVKIYTKKNGDDYISAPSAMLDFIAEYADI